MRIFTVFFFALFSMALFSQNSKIYPKGKIILGEENTFVYEPTGAMNISDGAAAKYAYIDGYKNSPLVKKQNKYEFTVKVPDSIRAIIVSFFDKKGELIDNNFDKGFPLALNNADPAQASLDKVMLMQNTGGYLFKLNHSKKYFVEEYERLFEKSPKLKDKAVNLYPYLSALSSVDPKKEIVVSKELAQNFESKSGEQNLIAALNLYDFNLKDSDKANSLSKIILEKYPNGELAKSKLIQKFFKEANDPTNKQEQKVLLQYIEDYKNNYPKDAYTNQIADEMNGIIFKKIIESKDWKKINDFTKRFNNNFYAAQEFNASAWKFADGDDITSAGNDLEFAEKLARKSLEIFDEKVNNLDKYQQKSDFDQSFTYYTDALALVLYKEKKYQEAFDEQSKIIDSRLIDDSNRERYVLYAQKAKGDQFVKNYLDHLLKEQKISDSLFNSLTAIYKVQNLPTVEIEKLKEENKKTATNKSRKELLQFYSGDLKAKDFELTTLKGNKIKLSDLKGKIVVLDFWATWCGPCRAALPHMQELVKKYDESEVVFLFINTLERTKPVETEKKVTKFMADNKYDLNVLFDHENEVSKKYLVSGVPVEIVIDKEGNLLSRTVGYDGNLAAIINENK